MEIPLNEAERLRGISLLRPLPEQVRAEPEVQNMAAGIARVEFPNELIGQVVFAQWVNDRVLAYEEPACEYPTLAKE